MSIPVITNFSINTALPIDSRFVVDSEAEMYAIKYKYVGLATYRTDTNQIYTYDGNYFKTSNGIYGGSGNLNVDNTTVGYGTVSTGLNNTSKVFTISTNYESTGEEQLYLKNYFIRNVSGTLPFEISYKSQLVQFNGQDEYNGPYIIYNPEELFGSKRGGISFGTSVFGTSPTYERMRIDGNGIIRFKPNATVDVNTKSVNIGIDSTNTRPFIGFNWNGSGPDINATDASYVQFNNSVLSIHNFSSSTGTHSAIFSKGQVSINGALSTNKSISFGAADGSVYSVASNGVGFRYDSSPSNYAALTYRSTATNTQDILIWNNTKIELLRPTYAKQATNIWDNVFNPENSDSLWSILSSDDKRQIGTSNLVQVATTGGVGTQFNHFKFNIYSTTAAPYVALPSSQQNPNGSFSIRSYYLASKTYDRYLYFYNEGQAALTHTVEMFLLSDGYGLSLDTEANWNKVGIITNGNQNNYNSSLSDADYQVKFYSHSVLIPANMLFKIKFTFNYSYVGIGSSPIFHYVKTRVIRSGNWRPSGSTIQIQQEVSFPTTTGAVS